MKFSEKLYAVYLLFPYQKQLKFILSFLFGSKIKVFGYYIDVHDYNTILNLFSLRRFAKNFIVSNDGIKISFDGENNFSISKRLDKTDRVLLGLLNQGLKDGAHFVDEEHDPPIQYKKTIKIIQSKNIIETFEGVKFHLDNVGSTVEAFIRRIHDFYSENLEGKTVVDIGASVGDTPLYFVSRGAKVYAVEMTDTNYEAMLKNLELNPELAKRIIPIHRAFGKDEMIQYYDDALGLVSRQGGASFVKAKYDNSIKKQVQGASLSTLRKEYDLEHIDLLKLDCKGGEFFMKENELANIDVVKIEYYSLIKEHKVESLINMLKKNFTLIIYKHTPDDTTSIMKHGNILAKAK